MKIDGFTIKAAEELPGRITPLGRRLQGALDHLPPGLLWTARHASEQMGCAYTSIVRLRHELPDYMLSWRRRQLWGNLATIREAKKKMGGVSKS